MRWHVHNAPRYQIMGLELTKRSLLHADNRYHIGRCSMGNSELLLPSALYLLLSTRMSAYGAIVSSTVSRSALPSTIWSARRSRPNPGAAEAPSSNPPYLTLHHLTLSRAAALPGLIAYLHTVFAQFIEEGATYPQETAPGEMYQQQAFETYFFAGDVIVGIAGSGAGDQASQLAVEPNGPGEVKEINVDIDAARAGRTWEECVAGFYYV